MYQEKNKYPASDRISDGPTPARPRPTMAALTLFAVCWFLPDASAQPQWLTPDGSEPGTPATVEYDLASSNEDVSVFHVQVHGVYVETAQEGGDLFQVLTAPGLDGSLGSIGRPALPVAPLLLCIPTTAAEITIGGVDVVTSASYPGIRVFPAQPPHESLEGQPGEDPPFAFDATFYGQAPGPFPALSARALDEPVSMRRVRIQPARVHPFRVLPASNTLVVDWDMTVRFDHAGTVQPVGMTRRGARVMSAVLSNPYSDGWLIDHLSYDADYLIVTPPQYTDELDPFVRLKREQGYTVQVKTTDTTGSTSDDIKVAIEDWYFASSHEDLYVLLVGDTGEMPVRDNAPASVASDHMYACMPSASGDIDIYPDLGIGRLSVKDETDCAEQVAKQIAYQDGISPASGFGQRALLCAEAKESGGTASNYPYIADVSLLADMITGWMGLPVDVTEVYGYLSTGSDNAVLIDPLNAGQGVTIYKGSGSTSTWIWAAGGYGTAFSSLDVEDLHNGSETGVVITESPGTNSVSASSIGEAFMRGSEDGAVAVYGLMSYSLRSPSVHDAAYDMEYWLFLFLYGGYGYPTFIDTANAAFAMLVGSWDSPFAESKWQGHLLLGDPTVKVWTEGAYAMAMQASESLGFGPQILSVTVADDLGYPIEGAIVTALKDGEVLINRYTNASGVAHLPIEPLTSGELIVAASTDFDAALPARLVIPVASGSWFDEGSALAGSGGDPLLTGSGTLIAGSSNAIDLSNAASGALAGLFLGFSSSPVPFMGGTLMPLPIMPPMVMTTSPSGTIPFPFVMPAGVPSGTEIWAQWAIQDLGAPHGVALSNAVRGLTP